MMFWEEKGYLRPCRREPNGAAPSFVFYSVADLDAFVRPSEVARLARDASRAPELAREVGQALTRAGRADLAAAVTAVLCSRVQR